MICFLCFPENKLSFFLFFFFFFFFFFLFFFEQLCKFKIFQLNWGNRVAICLERVANSDCHLLILWLFKCICLSYLLVLGLDVDLIVSVPEFTYLL